MATLKFNSLSPIQKEALIQLAETDNQNFAVEGKNGHFNAIDFAIEKFPMVVEALKKDTRRVDWSYLDLSTDVIEFDYNFTVNDTLVVNKLYLQFEDNARYIYDLVLQHDDIANVIEYSTIWDGETMSLYDFMDGFGDDNLYVIVAAVLLQHPSIFEEESEEVTVKGNAIEMGRVLKSIAA